MVPVAGRAEGEKVSYEVKIKGIVQGVGFRPFLYRLARQYNLSGWVRNGSDGVLLVVEGDNAPVEAFFRRLTGELPRQASIRYLKKKKVPPSGFASFEIILSEGQADREPLIPPDLAACPECMQEVLSFPDRHYRYPFTNCTQCGPRFTIIHDLPYDRSRTTMAAFAPCLHCASEYRNPVDRRFHAQPVACPSCGPSITVTGPEGRPVTAASGDAWLPFFWEQMESGQIFAVKGLGGFHLACNLDQEVIARLRERKSRPWKPLAVMCRDMEAVRRYCRVSKREAELLLSPAAPIVLLNLKRKSGIPPGVNPNLASLGVMLPYTPLHFLLLQGPFDCMVLTSANPADLPVIKDNGEALEELRGVADYFLLHNRDIHQRCDDSVVKAAAGKTQFIRRSRGYVPGTVDPGFSAGTVVLGSGAEMKNTFCLLYRNQALLSQHQGEMGTLEAEKFYRDSLGHFTGFLGWRPEIIGYDPHPSYTVSALARSLPAREKYAVQHHHAHFASCLAENRFRGEAIGLILDGTGYGLDGNIWGFEVLAGNFQDFTREYHQRYVPLPGGEAAVRHPWRTAASYLYQSLGEEGLARAEELFGRRFSREWDILRREIVQQRHSVPASSCGRLFDAVSSLLGLCQENSYEGQAAVELSALLEKEPFRAGPEAYPFVMEKDWIDFSPVFPAILDDLKRKTAADRAARRFHDTVAEALVEAAARVAARRGLSTVALSGGAWHNPYLLHRTCLGLRQKSFKVLLHRLVPPGDGGLSLGQAAVAYWRWKGNVPGSTHENHSQG